MKTRSIAGIIALVLALVMITGLFAGCAPAATQDSAEPAAADSAEPAAADDNSADAAAPAAEGTGEAGGKIIWLSNVTSGAQLEAAIAFAEAVLTDLGYEFEIVYGDMMNDPAGNLQAVQNAMSSDVVGIIMSQDGGVKAIMDEYPDLYVAGYNTDMLSVFAEDGDNAAVLSNEKFLGTIADGYYDGTLTGTQFFDAFIAAGHKTVSIITFPSFAYPNLGVAAETFISKVDEYNATAADADKITIVGETKVLEFAPLEEDYFLQDGMGDLDVIAGFCAGVMFIYPTMVSAVANGSCSADTKLMTSGFETTPDIIADIGEDKTITWISISPLENIVWSMIMLDNAITGNMYPDFAGAERINSREYVIDSQEDIDNVMSKSIIGTGDFANAQISLEDVRNHLVRFNPDATYAALDEFFHSEQLSTDELKNR